MESIVVPDRRLGRALVLRDTEGVATNNAVLPMDLVPILEAFDGSATCEQIARSLGHVPVDLVVRLATQLEDALFVDGPAYRRERDRVERAFAASDVRPASHAGGSYYGDGPKLAAYIDDKCLAAAAPGAPRAKRSLRALVAPHIDPWRGARSYGEAYGAFRAHLPDDVDTFVVFGTSHAPMREPFALCRKSFDTPLGPVAAATDAIDRIAAASEFDPYADQFNHKREHSLEFQAVFLRHLLGKRRARIVPILAGLGEHQMRRTSPARTRVIEKFFDAVREVVRDTRAVVIAGADLAHVGPRFGDRHPLDAPQRRELDRTDRASIAHAAAGDAEGFWSHVASDLETRRVCGLAPVYALLRTLAPSARGEAVHYEQTVDPEEGSIVSHAAIAFHG